MVILIKNQIWLMVSSAKLWPPTPGPVLNTSYHHTTLPIPALEYSPPCPAHSATSCVNEDFYLLLAWLVWPFGAPFGRTLAVPPGVGFAWPLAATSGLRPAPMLAN